MFSNKINMYRRVVHTVKGFKPMHLSANSCSSQNSNSAAMDATVCEGLDVTIRNGLQIIKFNRPNKRNAFTVQMYENITRLLNDAAKDEKIIMTALTGSGDFYSSGNDMASAMKDIADDGDVSREKAVNRVRNFVSAFIDYPKILVAVVNGPAIGIAATTLGLCDVVYASDKAYFLTPFTKLGLVAEGCSSYTFPRIMGISKASEMLYFGCEMNAQEAKECGLVSQVFSHTTLNQEIWPKLDQIIQLPKMSMIYSKWLVRASMSEELHKANIEECKRLQERFQSEESFNAVMNFMNRKSKL